MPTNPNDPNKQLPGAGAGAGKSKPQPPQNEQEQKRAQAAASAQKVEEVISSNRAAMSELSKKHSKEIAAQGAKRSKRAPTATAEGADMRAENDANADRKLGLKHEAETAEAKAKLKPLILSL